MAPSPSDEGQYLISLVVPEPKRAKKSQPPKPHPLQIIPIQTEVANAKDVKKTKKAPAKRPSATTNGEEVVQPAEAMVEREAMAIFRDISNDGADLISSCNL